RVMTDPEGVRNLVGTGLAQLTGGLVTASVGLCVLFWLNWKLTFVVISILSIFGFGMVYAFIWLRPVFRKRGEITAAGSRNRSAAFGW
ncbi:MAG: ABC transporter transmembrane domain-containing protein, partial [Candidatus Hydrogenedentes bacterium]|nr:ABC transporter transmembrane domain-containing protein [Candidatus Hydrogenedentota bacterium]